MTNTMLHWINWAQEAPLVLVANDSSLCIGTCKSEDLFAVDQKLTAGIPIATVLENTTLTIIQFKNLVEIRYVNNATSVRVRYQNKNKYITEEIELASIKKAESFFDHLSQYVTSHMVKRRSDKSHYYGLVIGIASVFFSAVFLFSFFNIHRFVAYLVPALCILGTVGYVLRMESIQRDMNRWTIKSNINSIGTQAIKATTACVVFSIFAWGASSLFHDNYGEKALYEAAKRDSLASSQISGYLNRGSNVNFIDEDNTTALWWSIKHRNEAVSLSLITQGANVQANNGRLLEHALQHQASEALLRPMLKNGVLEVAELYANFNTKQYLDSENQDFTKAFYWYRSTY